MKIWKLSHEEEARQSQTTAFPQTWHALSLLFVFPAIFNPLEQKTDAFLSLMHLFLFVLKKADNIFGIATG